MENVEPRPSPSLVTRTLPPCNSVRCRTIESPTPRPPKRRVVLASAWLKPIEDLREKFRCDPLAGVAHANLHVRVDPLNDHVNPPAARRKFDRVREQIPHDLLQAIIIAHHRPAHARKGGGQPDLFGDRGRPHRLDPRRHHRREIDWPNVEA